MEYSEVSIQRNVLSDINYQYELECVATSQERVAQCYLVLGVSNEGTYTITRCLQVPMAVVNNSNFSFEIDVGLLRRRYELVKQVLPMEAMPLGLMLLNSSCYNYDEVLEQSFLLNKLGFTVEMELLLKYEPGKVDNGDSMSLECMVRDPRSVMLEFNRALHQIVDSVANVAIVQGAPLSSSTQQDGRSNISSVSALEQFADSNEQEEQLAQGLIKRVDHMIDFLKSERAGPATEYDEDYETVLRKVSLLVSQLELGSTDDIENEVLSMENEIKVLQIACNQWEMATPR